jgi:hypothetical protein
MATSLIGHIRNKLLKLIKQSVYDFSLSFNDRPVKIEGRILACEDVRLNTKRTHQSDVTSPPYDVCVTNNEWRCYTDALVTQAGFCVARQMV